jgi:hypothetical protein
VGEPSRLLALNLPRSERSAENAQRLYVAAGPVKVFDTPDCFMLLGDFLEWDYAHEPVCHGDLRRITGPERDQIVAWGRAHPSHHLINGEWQPTRYALSGKRDRELLALIDRLTTVSEGGPREDERRG